MTKRLAFLAPALLLALAGGAPTSAAWAADTVKKFVVAELFTSQGCYSCPPADKYLGVLSRQPGVIALSFHIDYWNYLGWADPYSSHNATTRQRAYAWAMHRPSVYTPQMVIDGRYQAVGSYTGTVAGLVRRAHANAPQVNVTIERLPDAKLAVSVAPVAGRAAGLANIWLILFDKARTTDIPRGENAGKRLTYHHVVREMRMVGDYAGKPVARTLSAKGADGAVRYGAAVLVQRPRAGAIVGAAVALASGRPAATK